MNTNLSWSMDFFFDGMAYGRRFRRLDVVGDHMREYLAIEIDASLLGLQVKQAL
ncbi:hypothetical protein [Burkholderia ubonensis]|uniref:hypothetical protein n=1 Tax=Burkholderia ubonensis TaxID=101571 RepID=UPI000AD42B2F|nr:hypothetical protein [Burkholderia ubonensis]